MYEVYSVRGPYRQNGFVSVATVWQPKHQCMQLCTSSPASFEVAGDSLGSLLCIYVKNTDKVRRLKPTIHEIFITFVNNRTCFQIV